MHEPRIDVLCCGALGVNLFAEEQNADLSEGGLFRTALYGPTANVAVGLARTGVEAGVCGRVPARPFGAFLLRSLEREGVDVARVETVEGACETSVPLLETKPDNASVFVAEGSASGLKPVVETFAGETLRTVSSLLVSDLRNLEASYRQAVFKVAEIVKRNGGQLILNFLDSFSGDVLSEEGAELALPLLEKAGRGVYPYRGDQGLLEFLRGDRSP